jgi:hypothetical protein
LVSIIREKVLERRLLSRMFTTETEVTEVTEGCRKLRAVRSFTL